MLLRKEVVEGEEYTLLSSHSLLVVLSHPPNLELLAHITDTLSLKRLEESLKPLELQDCLNAFVKRYVYQILQCYTLYNSTLLNKNKFQEVRLSNFTVLHFIQLYFIK